MKRVKRRVLGEDLMAYVVMAVGTIMCAVGLYFTVTGSQIVQVEAGWTSVIAGSALLSGGVVTIALGLVTRILLKLHEALASRPSVPAAMPDVERPAPQVPQNVPKPQDAPKPQSQPQPLFASAETPPFPSAHTPMSAEVPPVAEPKYQMPPPLPYFVAVHAAPVDEPDEHALAGMDAMPPEALDADHLEPAAHAADEEVHPADDYKIGTPSTPEYDLPAVEPEPSSRSEPAQTSRDRPSLQPASNDWLDQALAAIDKEIPLQAPKRGSDSGTPMPTAVDHATREPEHPVPDPTPAVEPATTSIAPVEPVLKPPEPAASASTSTSAIIGRYEADGTSYIMYADGSIEAQSEAGVYRFASMAELKAHIES